MFMLDRSKINFHKDLSKGRRGELYAEQLLSRMKVRDSKTGELANSYSVTDVTDVKKWSEFKDKDIDFVCLYTDSAADENGCRTKCHNFEIKTCANVFDTNNILIELRNKSFRDQAGWFKYTECDFLMVVACNTLDVFAVDMNRLRTDFIANKVPHIIRNVGDKCYNGETEFDECAVISTDWLAKKGMGKWLRLHDFFNKEEAAGLLDELSSPTAKMLREVA